MNIEQGEGEICKINKKCILGEQNELVCWFKMTVSDMIGIGGLVLKYTDNPTEMKRQLVRFGVSGN